MLKTATLILISITGAFAEAAMTRPQELRSMADSKPEILIYYANETNPTRAEKYNYEIILKWLKTSNNELANKHAQFLERDLVEFKATVDREVEGIKTAFATKPTPLGGALIFTNEMAKAGEFAIVSNSVGFSIKSGLKKYTGENPFIQSQPLMNSQSLASALTLAAEYFDPTLYQFVLITKSHGRGDLALTNALATWNESTNPKELIEMLETSVDLDSPPSWYKNRPGIKKEEFFDILSNAGANQNMQFSLVFLESCSSEVQDLKTVSNNIGILATTDGTIDYSNLDYRAILNDVSETQSLSKSLSQMIYSKVGAIQFIKQKLNEIHKKFRLVIHFIPFCLLMLWLARNSYHRISKSGGGVLTVTK